MEDASHSYRGHGLHLLIHFALALAAPSATLRATVNDDGTIQGTIRVDPGIEVVDPLAALPEPDVMLHRIRTFPGRPNRGTVRFEAIEPGVYRFETRLPRRFGGVGRTRHGLYAHGAFYPQPLIDGRSVPMDWDVRIDLPSLGVVGDTVGVGPLEWSGRADRVTLAMPKRSRAWTIDAGGHRVVVLGKRGRPRPFLWNNLRRTLRTLPPQRVVLVEGPLRRRLYRAGVGVSLVSDRFFRLAPLFQSFHRPALVESLEAAGSRLPHPQLRELVGWSRAEAWMDRRRVGGAEGFTRLFTWVPSVDALISSRRIPFYREIFREVELEDPVHDDLFEVFAPHRTGAGVATQLDARWGKGTSSRVSDALELGLSLPQSLQLLGLDPKAAAAMTAPVPAQDYRLDVDADVRITRVTESDAPEEVLMVAIEGKRRPVRIAPGETVVLDGRPGRVVVDPERHVPQTSRMGDAWPVGKLRVTASSWMEIINLSRFRFVGGVQGTLRGREDTRNLFLGGVSTSRRALVRVDLGYNYKFGPLRFGISRQHALKLRLGGSVIDPAFQSLEDGRFSVGGSVGWSFTNLGGSVFPVEGQSASLFVSGNLFPTGSTRSIGVRASASAVVSPHPRHAFAARVQGSIARATRDDLLPVLAGPGKMRSFAVLPPCGSEVEDPCATTVTDFMMVAAEYRVAALRGLSVPLGWISWGTEYQLSLGAEAVMARTTEDAGAGLGATLGVTGVYDNWGAEPSLVGFTAGWPLMSTGLGEGTKPTTVPELFLRFSQAF